MTEDSKNLKTYFAVCNAIPVHYTCDVMEQVVDQGWYVKGISYAGHAKLKATLKNGRKKAVTVPTYSIFIHKNGPTDKKPDFPEIKMKG